MAEQRASENSSSAEDGASVIPQTNLNDHTAAPSLFSIENPVADFGGLALNDGTNPFDDVGAAVSSRPTPLTVPPSVPLGSPAATRSDFGRSSVSTVSGPHPGLLRQWSTSNVAPSGNLAAHPITPLAHATLPESRTHSMVEPRSPVYDSLHHSMSSMMDFSSPSPLVTPKRIGTTASPRLTHTRAASHGPVSTRTNLESHTAITAVIHDAARIMNWRSVETFCKTHPHCARYKCPDHYTALHHACSRRCPQVSVVEALVEAYPDAMLELDEKGWTPLHHACRFKAPEAVVTLLLQAYPEKGRASARKRCNKGRSAVWYAIRYDAPDGVMEMLLEADPSSVLDEDREGVSPLGLVWDKFATSFEGKRALMPYMKRFESFLEAPGTELEHISEQPAYTLTEGTKLNAKWERSMLLLRGAFQFPLQYTKSVDNEGEDTVPFAKTCDVKERRWRELHATAAIKCHPTLFILACVLFPEQAREIDDNDLFGYNSASIASSLPAMRSALHFAAASPAQGKDGRTVILALLALYPDAAHFRTDADGSLPLHVLASNENKFHWIHDGFRDVYQANPLAASIQDTDVRTPLHRATAIASLRQPSTPLGSPTQPQSLCVPNSAGDVGSIIQNLVERFPDAAKVADVSGRLPLHLIAELGEAWDNDAESVLRAYPLALQKRAGHDAHNRLPIHMAASSPDAKSSLIEHLICENPRSVCLPDKLGKLSLHLACELGKTWDSGVRAIYEAYPGAIGEQENNERRFTALHFAAASPNARPELIDRLVDLCPAAAATCDGKGRRPLHWACITGKSWAGGLEVIFRAFSEAAESEDSVGWLPFHAAAMSYCTAPSTVEENAAVGPIYPTPLFTPCNREGENHVSTIVESMSFDEDERVGEKTASGFIGSSYQGTGNNLVEVLTKVDILYNLLSSAPHVLK